VEKKIQAGFQVLALLFQGWSPILGADPYGGVHQEDCSAERQGHFEVVPSVEGNSATGSRGYGKNRPVGLPGQIEDPLLGHVDRTPGAICSQCRGRALADVGDQTLERLETTFGAGSRADLISQPPSYLTDKLAVPAGAGHDNNGGLGAAEYGAEIKAPQEVAVPQGKDDRGL